MTSLSGRMTEYAYAKINTFLTVTGRREDGYHELLSHMQALTLHDTLILSWQAAQGDDFHVTLRCDDPSLPCDEDNLIVRAARALWKYMKRQGRTLGGTLEIDLQKRIPMAAGLAGGSADAAATLRGFHALLDFPLSDTELCDIGASIGADVPFCLWSTKHPAMTARGIGDILSPTISLPQHGSLVVACGGEGVSTPWAFRHLDELGEDLSSKQAELAYEDLSSALLSGELSRIASHSYNCFEAVVLPERPVARALMDAMTEKGAIFSRMSGSGPSVVGYFDDEDKAVVCANELLTRGVRAYVTKPLSEKL